MRNTCTVYKIRGKFTHRVSCKLQTYFKRKSITSLLLDQAILPYTYYQLSASAQAQTKDDVIDKLAEEIRHIKVCTQYGFFLIDFCEFPRDGYLCIYLVQNLCCHTNENSVKRYRDYIPVYPRRTCGREM